MQRSSNASKTILQHPSNCVSAKNPYNNTLIPQKQTNDAEYPSNQVTH